MEHLQKITENSEIMDKNKICLKITPQEQHRSSYQKMLNNIASDLDLLLNDLCHIHPYQDSANSTKFKTFGKGQNYSDSSPGFGEDSAFGTLASTDSFNSDQKLRSDSVQSTHLEVFGLNHQGLVIPSYPKQSISSSDLRSITTVERLTKTHPIWCLPDVGRSGAVHLLKDREIGTFIVRNSSQPNTMALSVQFPENGQQNVDHYLIESTPDGFRLNGSLHFFKAIPELLAYYCENIDELPHKLLPLPAIRNARTLQELVSLSHLGQDLWTSSKFEKGSTSNLSSASSNAHAALHKSVSEPINITKACKLNQSNHSIPITLPSPLVKNVGNTSTTDSGSHDGGHSSNKSSHSVDSLLNRVGDCSVPLHMSKSKSDSAFSMHEGSALCEMCGSKISVSSQSRTVSPASSMNSGENSRSNSSHSSLKNKSTLYFTTPIELLHIPENQYFKSELSDKMSDYEDIWKSSAAHTPMSSMKNTPVPSVRHSVASSTGPNISMDLSVSHADSNTLNNMCYPDLKEIPQKLISTSLHNDLNSQQNMTCQQHIFKSKNNIQRALSLDEASNQKCEKVNVEIDKLSERGLTKAETKSTTSVCTQTSPVVVKHKPPNLKSVNSENKEQYSANRKSNSSTSTVVSSLKSPVYAEPFDALSPTSAAKEMCVYVPRVRRRSAPSMGAQSRKLRAVSHNPTLETIFSPDCDNTQNFEFKENGAINERLMDSEFHSPPSSMRRTQSAKVRSTRDRDNRSNPMSKENLEEVKAKLESLNTKRKVKRTQSENIRQTNTEGLNLKSVKKELKLLEEYSEKGKTTATSTLRKFPVYKRHISVESSTNSDADWSTMEDMISQNNPGLTVKPIKNLLLKSHYRVMSEYDNLSNQYAAPSAKSRASTGTVFCKPWDNSLLDKLMVSSDPKLAPPMDLHERIMSWQIQNERYSGSSIDQGTITDSEHCEPEQDGVGQNNQRYLPAVFIQPPSSRDSTSETLTDCKEEILSSSHQTLKVHSSDDEGVKSESGEEVQTVPLDLKKPVIQKQSPTHHHNHHQHHTHHHPDVVIRDYIVRLSHDKSTTFGSTIENFIQCTIDSQETNPHIVTRNVRQFMTGIKNYLVKHGEGQLEDTIEKERKRLSSNEILNIDATIERALHVCVLQPLKHHIYTLFVNEYTRNGSLRTLSNNIKYARTKSAEDIGLRPGLSPPDGPTIDTIKQHFNKMQKAYSPVKKLENLLKATSCIHSSVSDGSQIKNGPVAVGADDFLPMLIYVLVHCGLVAAEIEADYIWDLIHQSLLNGEAGYYLTSLSSAVLVIKNFREMQETSVSQHEGRLPSISDMQGFLKLAIPDELHDSITWKTLPVRPNMTTKDVCSMIAHKFKITNLQDYGLYILVKGQEIKLGESECPQVLKVDYLSKGDECVFAFKRIAANIAWPMSMKTQCL